MIPIEVAFPKQNALSRVPTSDSCRYRRWTILAILSLLGCQVAPLDTAAVRHRQHHLVRQDQPKRSGHTNEKIPRLLHYIYLTGLEAYTADTGKPNAKLNKKHFEGCQNYHQHWDSLFWDEEMGFQFIKEHYSWFVPVWESFDGWGKQAKKSDVLRMFVMHYYGGLYLDLDIECYKAADDSLKGHQLVVQGSGDEGINNAVMASVPGHPYWLEYAKEIATRSKQGSNMQFNSPMYMSGTLALTRALIDFIKAPVRPVSGYNSYEYQANGSIKVYALGEWYFPCYGVDHICQRQFEKEYAEGIWDLTDIYGRHHFAELPSPLESLLVDQYVT